MQQGRKEEGGEVSETQWRRLGHLTGMAWMICLGALAQASGVFWLVLAIWLILTVLDVVLIQPIVERSRAAQVREGAEIVQRTIARIEAYERGQPIVSRAPAPPADREVE